MNAPLNLATDPSSAPIEPMEIEASSHTAAPQIDLSTAHTIPVQLLPPCMCMMYPMLAHLITSSSESELPALPNCAQLIVCRQCPPPYPSPTFFSFKCYQQHLEQWHAPQIGDVRCPVCQLPLLHLPDLLQLANSAPYTPALDANNTIGSLIPVMPMNFTSPIKPYHHHNRVSSDELLGMGGIGGLMNGSMPPPPIPGFFSTPVKKLSFTPPFDPTKPPSAPHTPKSGMYAPFSLHNSTSLNSNINSLLELPSK